MTRVRMAAAGVLALLGVWGTAAPAGAAHVGVSIGLGFGVPVYRPYCYHPYYRPYGVYVAPAPVYLAPAPVYVQPAPAPVVIQQVPVVAAPAPVLEPVPAVRAAVAAPAPSPQPVVVSSAPATNPNREAAITAHLQKLTDPNDQVRCDAVEQLGRLHADRAVDSLAAVLAGDRSPMVRDAAARSLGLIGAPKALPALIRAAQA